MFLNVTMAMLHLYYFRDCYVVLLLQLLTGVLGSVLAEKTTCPDSTQDNGSQLHYDVHSLYGLSQAMQTVPLV